MEELLNGFAASLDDSFSVYTYVLYSIICALLLFVLSIVYTRFGQSISNRSQLSKVLVIVGLTTFIIISIVKSSLALSLGLVGALSIVRFRTAIKEPEELGYFFMAISIGLGMGANQLFPTLIGFVILMLIVILQSGSKLGGSITQMLLITIPEKTDQSSALIENVSDIIGNSSSQLEVKRVQMNDDSISMNFLINVNTIKKLNEITQELQTLHPNIEITFLDTTI